MGVFNPLKEEYRWININAVPQFRTGEDKPYQVYTIFDDITERKRTEEELRKGELFLESVFASIQDGIGVIDKDMNILRVNLTAERWYPHAAPLIGRKCYEAYHGRSERCEGCPAWKTLKTGESAYKIVPKHGPGGKEVGWLEIYSFPMIDTATGEMRGAIEYVRDITERKRVEKEKDRLLKAIDSSTDGITIADEKDRFIYVNAAYAKIFGYPQEEFIGETWRKITLPELIVPTERELSRTMHNKDIGTFRGEVPGLRKDGIIIPTEVQGTALRDENGNYQGHICVVRDITERKRAEEAIKKYAEKLEEANRMKELFTDIMHHDLINPLTAASGFIELLKEDEIKSQKRAYLGTIDRNLVKALELMESATRLSKLESSKSIELMDMDLEKVINEVTGNMSPLAADAGMMIENRINMGMSVRANKIIEEVFANVISNAIKYASSGKRIVLDCEKREGCWNIRVTDFGEGIEDRDKKAIFDRFHRLEKKGVKGSGLGLAIASKIMELHNGRIWVEDNPEGGAVFVIEIPKHL
jgi:PAS domain S-box-containing protein